ncbi:MAG: hypothetical protein JWQ25_2986, partial [Daejeonella sp.]|nr:hypothetical protein [Daejeonella sp.]
MRNSLLGICSAWLIGSIISLPAHATSGSNQSVIIPGVKSVKLNGTITTKSAIDVVVAGTIKDDKGETLPGVGIKLKGSQISTVSDIQGNYKISLPETGGILVFTYVGFATKQVAIKAGTAVINVTLETDNKSLEEVVVVGYGTVKKKDLTGSVSVVNVKDAKKTATYDVAKMLQGQVAGVTVQGSGEPGGYVSIKIRGTTSFGSNNPLFVIDGIPVNDPYDFAPGEIETIQVLKDASAAAIYGSRAANGIVIITTKKGKSGALKVNFNSYAGVQDIAKKIDVTDRLG